ncbi:hypothetical protein BDZ91DRAFT_531088 [Kalaharituber pfeilii]|nr:hypothetical protein BDZ91DRAFT_531088 [Kalaharituber pfeilii]
MHKHITETGVIIQVENTSFKLTASPYTYPVGILQYNGTALSQYSKALKKIEGEIEETAKNVPLARVPPTALSAHVGRAFNSSFQNQAAHHLRPLPSLPQVEKAVENPESILEAPSWMQIQMRQHTSLIQDDTPVHDYELRSQGNTPRADDFSSWFCRIFIVLFLFMTPVSGTTFYIVVYTDRKTGVLNKIYLPLVGCWAAIVVIMILAVPFDTSVYRGLQRVTNISLSHTIEWLGFL